MRFEPGQIFITKDTKEYNDLMKDLIRQKFCFMSGAPILYGVPNDFHIEQKYITIQANDHINKKIDVSESISKSDKAKALEYSYASMLDFLKNDED